MRTILFLLPAPFTRRDFSRFGVGVLRGAGWDVRIWDCSRICRLDIGEEAFPDPDLRVFRDQAELIEALGGVDRQTTAVFSFLLHGRSTHEVLHALDIFGLTYCTPVHFSPPPLRPSFLARLRNVLRTRRKQLLDHLFEAFSRRTADSLNFSVPCVLGGLAALQSLPAASRERAICTHTLDYDLYLEIKDEPPGCATPYAVFLDEDMAFHVDYERLGIRPYARPEEYYLGLCRFFDQFESVFGMPVVIALHPRARQDMRPYFGSRELRSGQTASLVKDASVVLLHNSTSVNFAVLFAKPLCFLTCDALERSRLGPYIANLAIRFGKTPFNVDHFRLTRQTELNLEVSREAYTRFTGENIKVPGSADGLSWLVLAEELSRRFQLPSRKGPKA